MSYYVLTIPSDLGFAQPYRRTYIQRHNSAYAFNVRAPLAFCKDLSVSVAGTGWGPNMGKAKVLPGRPAMWAIEAGTTGPGSEIARFGQRRFRVADLEHIQMEEIRDRNEQGLLMGAIVFVCFATALAYLVFDAGWRERFLIGTAFLAFLGLMGLGESYTLQTVKLYELVATLKSGERVVFTSSDRPDIEALALRLQASRGPAA